MLHNESNLHVHIANLEVTSPNFKLNDFIPRKFTCDGENINPQLNIAKIPDESKSICIIMDDPDAPVSTWTHWILWNIVPQKTIAQNFKNGVSGTNDFGTEKYSGPCPPYGVHTYYFRIYALDTLLTLKGFSKRQDLEKYMSGHVLAYGELTFKYKKEK